MIFIFILSSIPDTKVEALGSWEFLVRKIAHAFLFGVLATLIGKAWQGSRQRSLTGKQGVGILCFAVLYAASDEWHQIFVPGRYGTVLDVVIDTVGAIGGTVGVLIKK
jgi:VanZ family protein